MPILRIHLCEPVHPAVVGVIAPVFLFGAPKELFSRADSGLERKVVVLSLTGWFRQPWESLEGGMTKCGNELR